jgi:predicted unusual protein kinase regulating ubiquinone biosynthesis (AarF/ABC1/UbiB family)
MGQALSTRADLLPLAYVEALGELQDKVPGFSSTAAIALIEAELKQPIHLLYAEFDPVPIAAASLGQVHKARLPTGEAVVVKVQRPGLERLFNLDLKALHHLVGFCERYFSWAQTYRIRELYNEFFSILYQEIDYIQEGKNADRFRLNFQDEPRVLVPRVFWNWTTSRILTVDYLPGIKINDRKSLEAAGIDLKKLNRLGIYCYLKQLLQDGFFQADPHPGNMAVTPRGQIIFYDFGMMAEVKSLAKETMVKTLFAVLRKDASVLIDTLVELGLLERTGDMAPIRRMAIYVLDKFTEKPLDVHAFGEVRSELFAMFEQQPFRMPAQMMFILKSLATLDGIARVLDPEYNLTAAAQPFVKTLLANTKGGTTIWQEMAKQTKDLLHRRLRSPNPTELAIQRLEERLQQGDLQLKVRSPDTDRILRRIYLALKSLIYLGWTGFTLVAAAIFLASGATVSLGVASLVLSGLGVLLLLRSLIQLNLREYLDRLVDK